jgi:hypothetical protein
MAYIASTASSMADLQTAIETEAVARGWSLSSGILSKSGCFFKLESRESASSYIAVYGGTGQTTTTLDDQAQDGAAISATAGNTFSFPLAYEIHAFDDVDEIYCVVNYDTNYYQTIAFGISDVPGIGGTGAWLTGSYAASRAVSSSPNGIAYMSVSEASCGLQPSTVNAIMGPLWSVNAGSNNASFVHTGLDSTGWKQNSSATTLGNTFGMPYCTALLTSLPNLSNQSSPLIPVKAIQRRNSAGATIVASPKHARYLRIDNIDSGGIITLGADEWKCYPIFRKDSSQRDGVPFTTGATHTGTFGFAIRYQGS